jgi:NAD(P)-dependent dehydrogenase (short-subunit alcohol dehydrogenase family)
VNDTPGTSFDLTGRTALITGGGRGIGRTTAAMLAAAGARVVVVDIEPRNLRERWGDG